MSSNKKTASTDILNDMDDLVVMTASSISQGKDGCLSIANRPCYMRGAKAPQFWTQVGEQGAENAYSKCLLNPVLTGEALVWSAVCGNDKKERMRFCYQGHGFALYYLNGECVECNLPYCG